MTTTKKINETKSALAPLIGGIGGLLLQSVVRRRLARMGGLPGVIAGVAATWAINKYMNKKEKR